MNNRAYARLRAHQALRRTAKRVEREHGPWPLTPRRAIDHYILQGRRVVAVDTTTTMGLLRWAKWLERSDRRIAWDEIDGIVISTVFLGLDHGYPWLPDAPYLPVLFETMVFPPHYFERDADGNRVKTRGSEYQDRYCLLDDAEAAHARIVAQVKELRALGTDPEFVIARLNGRSEVEDASEDASDVPGVPTD